MFSHAKHRTPPGPGQYNNNNDHHKSFQDSRLLCYIRKKGEKSEQIIAHFALLLLNHCPLQQNNMEVKIVKEILS